MQTNETPSDLANLGSVDYLRGSDIDFTPVLLSEAPHTAREVCDLCQCPLDQVLKTLVLIGTNNSPVIAVAPGGRRVSFKKLLPVLHEKRLRFATPDEVLLITSSKPGEVSPFGLAPTLRSVMDERALLLSQVIVGSGRGTLLLQLTSQSLKSAWGGLIADISE